MQAVSQQPLFLQVSAFKGAQQQQKAVIMSNTAWLHFVLMNGYLPHVHCASFGLLF